MADMLGRSSDRLKSAHMTQDIRNCSDECNLMPAAWRGTKSDDVTAHDDDLDFASQRVTSHKRLCSTSNVIQSVLVVRGARIPS